MRRRYRDRMAGLGHMAEFGCELTGFEQDNYAGRHVLPGRQARKPYEPAILSGRVAGAASCAAHPVWISRKNAACACACGRCDIDRLGHDAWHQFNDGDMELGRYLSARRNRSPGLGARAAAR